MDYLGDSRVGRAHNTSRCEKKGHAIKRKQMLTELLVVRILEE